MPRPSENRRAYQGEMATTAGKESGAERHPDQTAQQPTGAAAETNIENAVTSCRSRDFIMGAFFENTHRRMPQKARR